MTAIAVGDLRGEKVLYPDGVGYCIWHPFSDDEETGIAFDFADEQMDDLILLLEQLKQANV